MDTQFFKIQKINQINDFNSSARHAIIRWLFSKLISAFATSFSKIYFYYYKELNSIFIFYFYCFKSLFKSPPLPSFVFISLSFVSNSFLFAFNSFSLSSSSFFNSYKSKSDPLIFIPFSIRIKSASSIGHEFTKNASVPGAKF